ncbi:SWI/SNF complex subunit SWI3C homolog isoform X2 [Telopea speciosissima]|uniref:SWI/SNF complex subunit SWI3C homolog isoform X2 n=1 Tax=Telopea speciosissima TaxID=54955 RepID=UPI001CC3DF79|nr:SWI/SNF complex subunit SWI3C homolog isoform X2 [Telopea speciosissima]
MSATLSFVTETRGKWKKRKRDANLGSNIKKQRPEEEDEEEEDDDEADFEEEEETHTIAGANAAPTEPFNDARESEILYDDGGVRVSEFPPVTKRIVNQPHSSVLSVIAAERAIQFPEQHFLQNQNAFFFENISHGQLQALSAVPADSPSLAPSDHDRDRPDAPPPAYVCTPPAIMEGRGVVKRFGNNRVLVVPMHSDWFSPNLVHRLERQVVPHFFSGKSAEHTPGKYMDCRNRVVAKYMENPEKRLRINNCQGLAPGIDFNDLNRIFRFLDHWGIINYSVVTITHEHMVDGPYLREDLNGEIQVTSAALKSIDSLIQFDKPKSRLRASDVSFLSFGPGNEVSDLDSRIRERLAENQCIYCSCPLPRLHYQSQKEADILLCSDCFHDGRFVSGHSSVDFIKVDSIRDLCDLVGDNWTDQETLLLLEALETYNDNWNEIAEHVGTKSKAQCILHLIRLPMEDGLLENIEVPSKSVSTKVSSRGEDGGQYSNPNCDPAGLDSESRIPFENSANPLMALVAFLASAVGPRVAAACAHASLAALSKEEHQSVASNNIFQLESSVHGDSSESACGREGNFHGGLTSSCHQKEESMAEHGFCGKKDTVSAQLPIGSVKNAAKFGLAAAATKAKLFAEHEEREIQRMAATIINHQLKRLELKLNQFSEVDTLLMKECEQMERTRQRIVAERARIISTRFGPAGTSNTTLPGAAAVASSSAVNNRPQLISASPALTNISAYGNNQASHPHMSFMPRPQMFAYGPRLPLSAIHPSSSAPSSSVMFTSPGNVAHPSLNHPLLRPVSGTNTNVG